MPVSTPCHSNDSSGFLTIEWANFFKRQRLMVVLGASPTTPTKTLLKVFGLRHGNDLPAQRSPKAGESIFQKDWPISLRYRQRLQKLRHALLKD